MTRKPSPQGLAIARAISSLRKDANLSQPELARASGGEIKLGWLCNVEAGLIENPSHARLTILAKWLGTTVGEIYHRAGIIAPEPTDLETELLTYFYRLTNHQKRVLIEVAKAFGA